MKGAREAKRRTERERLAAAAADRRCGLNAQAASASACLSESRCGLAPMAVTCVGENGPIYTRGNSAGQSQPLQIIGGGRRW
jgi:hypothetical protein